MNGKYLGWHECDVSSDLWKHVRLGVILPTAFQDDLATDVLPELILRSGNRATHLPVCFEILRLGSVINYMNELMVGKVKSSANSEK